jgi:ADP-ribose pyrophosphatase YjhB (NUDIX family)
MTATRGPIQRERPNRKYFLLGAGAVVVSPEERILMLKQERYGQIEWSGPGGALERDESVHDAALREVKEETGLDVRLERLIRVSEFWHDGHLTGVGFLFLARPDPWPQEVSLPDQDGVTRFLDYRWCDREEAAQLEGLWEHDVSRTAWPPEITIPLFDRLETVAE